MPCPGVGAGRAVPAPTGGAQPRVRRGSAAMGAFIAYSIIPGGRPRLGRLGKRASCSPAWWTLGYGHGSSGLPWPGAAPLVQSIATLGLALVLFRGHRPRLAGRAAASSPVDLPSRPTTAGSRSGKLQVSWTQVDRPRPPAWPSRVGHRRVPALLQAGHRDARDGQRPGDHRDARPVPVRRVEARRPGWVLRAPLGHRRGSCWPTCPRLDDTTLVFTGGDLLAGRRPLIGRLRSISVPPSSPPW